MIFKFYSIIKKSKINWINKLIKLLKSEKSANLFKSLFTDGQML